MNLVPKRKMISGVEETPPDNLLQFSQHIDESQIAPASIRTHHITLIDLDDIGDGSTYGKIYLADITAHHVKLSATVESASANYVTNNEKTGASDGYDFFESKLTAYGLSIKSSASTTRTELTATHIAGYLSNTLQFEIKASDGKGYFGAGACTLDTLGATIKGAKLILKDSAGEHSGSFYIDTNGYIRGDGWARFYTHTAYTWDIVPTSSLHQCGLSGAPWFHLWGQVLALDEQGGAPSATSGFGKVYTKSDNKLYFQDGDGTEHTCAFV